MSSPPGLAMPNLFGAVSHRTTGQGKADVELRLPTWLSARSLNRENRHVRAIFCPNLDFGAWTSNFAVVKWQKLKALNVLSRFLIPLSEREDHRLQVFLSRMGIEFRTGASQMKYAVVCDGDCTLSKTECLYVFHIGIRVVTRNVMVSSLYLGTEPFFVPSKKKKGE